MVSGSRWISTYARTCASTRATVLTCVPSKAATRSLPSPPTSSHTSSLTPNKSMMSQCSCVSCVSCCYSADSVVAPVVTCCSCCYLLLLLLHVVSVVICCSCCYLSLLLLLVAPVVICRFVFVAFVIICCSILSFYSCSILSFYGCCGYYLFLLFLFVFLMLLFPFLLLPMFSSCHFLVVFL